MRLPALPRFDLSRTGPRRGMTRAALLALGLLGAGPAWAYVDPNAGGWLYQLLFPVLVAIGAVWAGLRTQIKLWWARWRPGGRKTETPPSEGAADRHER